MNNGSDMRGLAALLSDASARIARIKELVEFARNEVSNRSEEYEKLTEALNLIKELDDRS